MQPSPIEPEINEFPTKALISELDWSTPFTSTDLLRHWRIFVCIILFVIVSVGIWHWIFPHTMPFLKLWTGFATGSVVGTLVGAYWQLQDCSRRSQTSGKFLSIVLLAWGFFSLLSLFLLAPQMYEEESIRAQMRSISSQKLKSISIDLVCCDIAEIDDGKRFAKVEARARIDEFCRLASNTGLFYPSHEGSLRKYSISLLFDDQTIEKFDARVPERHPNDISLQFRGTAHWAEVIIPDARAWIDKALASPSQ